MIESQEDDFKSSYLLLAQESVAGMNSTPELRVQQRFEISHFAKKFAELNTIFGEDDSSPSAPLAYHTA